MAKMTPQSFLEIAGLPVTKSAVRILTEAAAPRRPNSTRGGAKSYVPQTMNITYQGNYNGCTIYVDDGLTVDDLVRIGDKATAVKLDQCQDAIIEYADQFCGSDDNDDDYDDDYDEDDEDGDEEGYGGPAEGEFDGSVPALRDFAISTVRAAFGDAVTVTFEFDSSST